MTDAKMFISLLSKHPVGGQRIWLVGAECLDDSCKTVCRVRECDTADECGCGDDGDGDGGDDGVSVNINHTPHSTFSRHPDTALRTFLGIKNYFILDAVRFTLYVHFDYTLACYGFPFSALHFFVFSKNLQNPLAAKYIIF